jgi:hypothetical protein
VISIAISLSSMKRRILMAVTFGFMLLCASCLGARPTSFFSNFSVRELVERNQTSAGFRCDAAAGGGGADSNGFSTSSGGIGPGKIQFSVHRGDGVACALKSEENLDEQRLFAALKDDTERVLRDSGAQISQSGSAKPVGFYLSYTAGNVRGRVQISGTRIGNQYYDVHAMLEEQGH